MAWVDGMSLPIGAKNIDQAYAFIQYCYEAGGGGQGDRHPRLQLAGDRRRAVRQRRSTPRTSPMPIRATPLQKLNPWPAEPPWYADVRAQYVNKFQSAS